ncbi:MAG: RNA chaperone Hfq [Defluviitaleaceae bacterium]|nr:RNA chaperone Hfq [Defluviitaleaceae bacterium]
MSINYQDTFLNTVRKENIPLTIFLTSGFQIRCTIRAFDNYVLIIEVDGKQQMIFKHAVSTIAPIKTVLRLDSITENED